MTTDTPTVTGPVFKLDQPDDGYKFQPLPKPPGKYPYRLKFDAGDGEAMAFHIVGDTGGFRDDEPKHKVAAAMAAQYQNIIPGETPTQFLYHLGDVVYNFGEAGSYDQQFFSPYQHYPGPIFATAGNHDSDVNPLAEIPYKSLDPFMAVFCTPERQPIGFNHTSQRQSGVQPNVYFTLQTPLANIIGLHTNVTKFGVVTAEQRSWLIDELKAADKERPGKAAIIALHHAPYSADMNHGASKPMIELLEGVFAETGIIPDLVISGHVHNYQRFNKRYPNGKNLTYVVAGAGGYDELHPIAHPDDDRFDGTSPLFDGVQLVKYHYATHGFLKLTIARQSATATITGEYFMVGDERPAVGMLLDRFVAQVGG